MDIDFQKRLLATFKVETKEHLGALSAGLIALENVAEQSKRQEILEAVFREAHSLKGAARAVNLTGIEALSHALESVFVNFKRQQSLPVPDIFDLLHRVVDTIDKHLLHLGTAGHAAVKAQDRELILALEQAAKGSPFSPAPTPVETEHREPAADTKPGSADTVRIATGKLDALFHQTEEMLTAKLDAGQQAADLKEINTDLAIWEKDWKKLRPIMRKLRKVQQSAPGRLVSNVDAGQLGKLLDFFEAGHTALKAVQFKTGTQAKVAAANRHSLEGMVDNLLDDFKGVLMLPSATILEILPKMVRDLARDQGKDAGLVITGERVEIDKRVLEELKDPLIHLVRNCIDHGIEMPEERKRRNKATRGRISVAVSLVDSSRIEILVSDDGAGVDTGRLEAVAIRDGIAVREGASRVEDALLELIFKSGVSTSPLITDISGRGLGLAIVREKVEKLGGTVMVVSEPLVGTTFRLVLPLTLSTCRGVLVKAGGQTFIIPAASVETVLRVARTALRTVENREAVKLDGKAVSFIRLADVLQLPRQAKTGDAEDLIPLFVIGSGTGRIAFGVDSVVGEQEILVKSLGPQLARVRNVAGATVLGTGKVATILHPGDLMKSAVKGAAVSAVAVTSAAEQAVARRLVLIAEDSITARTLLKNILETAGYQVRTAVDGIDAMTQLRTEPIDLVVSDVDMPRMNGFDLTAKIRASKELADLPVVLVTSLDSREDRERGIEAGANAYIVKSSFDQSNLLEVIRRLI
jgi:two-component system, chemotaxis family, sensor kinase CheA